MWASVCRHPAGNRYTGLRSDAEDAVHLVVLERREPEPVHVHLAPIHVSDQAQSHLDGLVAAAKWPQLNFLIYHSCIRPGFWVRNALLDVQSGNTRMGVPDILWTTRTRTWAVGPARGVGESRRPSRQGARGRQLPFDREW
jgi:hypothetical protein